MDRSRVSGETERVRAVAVAPRSRGNLRTTATRRMGRGHEAATLEESSKAVVSLGAAKR